MATDNTCGIPGPVSKIVGGATADKYKYTWLAMLGRSKISGYHRKRKQVLLQIYCGELAVSYLVSIHRNYLTEVK